MVSHELRDLARCPAQHAPLPQNPRQRCVHDLQDATYFAELRLSRGAETLAIDMRPSDAVGICLTARAPLLIAERLLHPPPTSTDIQAA